jgi:hypothetical protein
MQLLVHARLEPFSSKVTNTFQYLGTGITFSMAFGGIMLSYMRLAQAEESQRLFGDEQKASFTKYEDNMNLIRGIVDAVLYTFAIVVVLMFGCLLWENRHQIKAKAGSLRTWISGGCRRTTAVEESEVELGEFDRSGGAVAGQEGAATAEGKEKDGEKLHVRGGIGITGMQARVRRGGSNELGGGDSWEGANPMHKRRSSMEEAAPDLDSPWHRPGHRSGSGADGGAASEGAESTRPGLIFRGEEDGGGEGGRGGRQGRGGEGEMTVEVEAIGLGGEAAERDAVVEVGEHEPWSGGSGDGDSGATSHVPGCDEGTGGIKDGNEEKHRSDRPFPTTAESRLSRLRRLTSIEM